MYYKMNRVITGEDWGVFLGCFSNNVFHQHYAVQINIPLYEAMKIISGRGDINSHQPTIIPSNVKHKIESRKAFVLILINPLVFAYQGKEVLEYSTAIIEKIKKYSFSYMNGGLDESDYQEELEQCLNIMFASEPAIIDSRIKKGVEFLKLNKHRTVSLSEISQVCCLSDSRFLHLFRSEMGITFRRAQLWYRVSQSLSGFPQKNITETAHDFGFTDSSHYSRIFKETFGFSPKTILKNSQFMQF